MKPRIFISAVTSELGATRQLVANVLLRLGYDPVTQDIFGTESGDLRQVLREKIDDCDGLIQLVGRSYGAEPPTIGDEFAQDGFTRISYTQFEFLYARARGKTTWLIYADEGCTFDHPLEQLDVPRDSAHPDPAGYQSERRGLQEVWRLRWKQEGHLRHGAASDTELELKVERLKDEFGQLRKAFRAWQQSVSRNLAIVAVASFVVGIGGWWTVSRQTGEFRRVVDLALTTAGQSSQEQHVAWDITSAPLFSNNERIPTQYSEVPAERQIAYEQTEINGMKAIICRFPYREALDRGDKVAGADFMVPIFAWNYPNIAIKVVNNSRTSVMITNAIIRVERVDRDEQPLLVIQHRSYNRIQFRNLGWGRVVDPLVRFSLAANADTIVSETGYEYSSPPIPSFEHDVAVPINEYFPNSLLTVPELRATGEITFGPSEKRSRVCFETTVLQELTSGRPVSPTFQYSVKLESQVGQHANPYHVGMAQAIESNGGTDQFLLRVGSDRSARYTISVELMSANHQSMGIQRLILDVFVPRFETAATKASEIGQ